MSYVIGVLRRVESLFNVREYPATHDDLLFAIDAVSDLIAAASEMAEHGMQGGPLLARLEAAIARVKS